MNYFTVLRIAKSPRPYAPAVPKEMTSRSPLGIGGQGRTNRKGGARSRKSEVGSRKSEVRSPKSDGDSRCPEGTQKLAGGRNHRLREPGANPPR